MLTEERMEEATSILDQIYDLVMLNQRRRQLKQPAQESSIEDLTELSNQYYELIPTSQYQCEALPIISNMSSYNTHKKTLIDLMYAEVVSKLLLAARLRIDELNPVDYYY